MTKTLEFFKSKTAQYILLSVLLIIWCIGTLKNPYMNFYNTDEFHAWSIAKYLSFTEIIRLMKIEGHTFLWYMVLKPFTYYDDILFPGILKTVNWFFMFLAVSLFLYKSRFNIFLKGLFIFSFPMFCLYPTYARCYSIGILFMFIVAILYKDRLKHPVLFASMIFFACNTSVFGIIGVAGLAIIFIIDLLMQRDKKIILPLIILGFTILSLFMQWFNFTIPPYVELKGYEISLVSKILFITGIPICGFYFFKCKQMLFYLVLTYGMMFFVAVKLYVLENWHTPLYFIFLTIAYMIATNIREKERIKPANILMSLYFICVCIIYSPIFDKKYFWANNIEYYKDIVSCIETTIPDNSTIYTDLQFPELIKNKTYKLKTMRNCDIGSYQAFYDLWTDSGLYYEHVKRYLYNVSGGSINIPTSSYIIASEIKHPPLKDNQHIQNCNSYRIYKIK